MDQIGVNEGCKLFGISKDSYYNATDKVGSLTTKYADLKLKIVRIIEGNPSYGYPRIKKELLNKYGTVVNHKLLLKLLKIWGLSLNRKVKSKRPTFIQEVLGFLNGRANLLKRMVIDGCFQVITSDFTEIPFKVGKAYLCVHIDYYGKAVYGYALGLSPNTNLILKSLDTCKSSLKRLGIGLSGMIGHSDQGSVYTSANYVTTVLEYGMYLSYSRKGEPQDNGRNESFFGRLKDEWRDVFAEADSFEELEKLVEKAINYYNERRLHSSIGYMTPWDYTKSYVKTHANK